MADGLTSWERRFRIETWTEYAIGVVIILLRLYEQDHPFADWLELTRRSAVRVRKLGGVSRLQVDDWVAMQTLVWYTLLCVALNRIVFGGGSNFMTPEEEAALTPETKEERVVGSKWVLVSEQSMIMSVWSCKVMMLIVYRTLTSGLRQERWMKAIAVYVFCGFLASQLTLFTACRPFSGYWSVPPISTQCWSYWHFEYVQGTFNVSADLLMMAVAIPLVAKVRLPWLQKAPLLAVFGLGILVIVAAVLTKVYCLVPALLSYEYLAWYHREVTLSIIVTMLPVLWSLLREVFPALRNWGYKTNSSSRETGSRAYGTRGSTVRMRTQSKRGGNCIERTGSEEHINSAPLEINKQITFSVEAQSDVDERDSETRQDRAGFH